MVNLTQKKGLAVAVNTPIVAAISFDGNVDDVAYEWSKRGTDDVLIGTPTEASTVTYISRAGRLYYYCYT